MLNTVVVGPRQYSDAKRRLKLWVKTEDAWTCVWQCARYLRQALFADWGLYTPWAVFLTTVRHCFLLMARSDSGHSWYAGHIAGPLQAQSLLLSADNILHPTPPLNFP